MRRGMRIRTKVVVLTTLAMSILTIILSMIGYSRFNDNVVESYAEYVVAAVKSADSVFDSCGMGDLINKRMMDEYYISLNELYDELGLPEITLGEDVGFNIDDGLIDIDHILGATLHNNETPVLVLNYDISAKYMEHRGGLFR